MHAKEKRKHTRRERKRKEKTTKENTVIAKVKSLGLSSLLLPLN